MFFSWLISFGLDWQIIQSSREALLYAVVLPLLTRRWVWRTSAPPPDLLMATE